LGGYPDDIQITFGALDLNRINQRELDLVVSDPQSLGVQTAKSSAVFAQEVKLSVLVPREETCEVRKLPIDFLLVDKLLADYV
jgi:hypothetical protein